MADMNTQEAGPILADDLMRDRARRFGEFLDDDVSSQIKCKRLRDGSSCLDKCELQLSRSYQENARSRTGPADC